MAQEEKVVQQALVNIFDWMDRKKNLWRRNRPPRVRVKFCGGCNPLIERADVANRIRDDLGDQVRWVREEEEADLAIMINGCLMACADRSDIKDKPKACLVIQGDSVSILEEKPNGSE